MNTTAIRQRLTDKRPAIDQRVRVFIYNFMGVEVVDGVYAEDNEGRPMIDGTKLHPLRTEWRPEIAALNVAR